jgi:hypothetical protein
MGAAMPPPLRLTETHLDIIEAAARPLAWRDRAAFLQTIVELLDGRELGDGAVSLAARAAQRQFFDPPDLSGEANQRRKYETARLGRAAPPPRIPLVKP